MIDTKFLNRYKRGLETCPQAKTSKSGHAILFSFFSTRLSDEYDSVPRLLASTFGRFRLFRFRLKPELREHP